MCEDTLLYAAAAFLELPETEPASEFIDGKMLLNGYGLATDAQTPR